MTGFRAATASVVLDIDPPTAFRVFTDEISSWWKPTTQMQFHATRQGVLHFETEPERRLVEIYPDGEHDALVIGRVLAWEPGSRLVFEWRDVDFAPGESTEVEVRFDRIGAGTRVSVEHRGWEELEADHPALHGLENPALRAMLGQRWADQLVAFRRQLLSGD